MFKQSFLSRQELESILKNKLHSVVVNKIVSAYEMAEDAQNGIYMNDGSPYFFHTSRVCKIIIDELNITDQEIIITSLLHNILLNSNQISHNVLDYNYGSYITFLIETLTEDYHKRVEPDYTGPAIDIIGEDGLIVIFADMLDDLRGIDFELNLNPVTFLKIINEKYLPHTEKISNPKIHYLKTELIKESNKIIG